MILNRLDSSWLVLAICWVVVAHGRTFHVSFLSGKRLTGSYQSAIAREWFTWKSRFACFNTRAFHNAAITRGDRVQKLKGLEIANQKSHRLHTKAMMILFFLRCHWKTSFPLPTFFAVTFFATTNCLPHPTLGRGAIWGLPWYLHCRMDCGNSSLLIGRRRRRIEMVRVVLWQVRSQVANKLSQVASSDLT